MNTQNPTFPFYGKTQTDAIFRFDAKYDGTCVKESCFWGIEEKWGEDAVSCLEKFYITPLTEQEIKDNNLPELTPQETKPENKMNPAVTFPLRAKYLTTDLIVEFTSEFSGSVVSGGRYKPGHHSDSWLYGCLDPGAWTILKDETKEMKLPDEFYILTENAAYWAAIEAKLFELGYTYYGDTSHREYENYAYIRGDSNKHLNYNPDTNPLKSAYPHAVEITMAELFAIPSPKPAFIEKDIYFHGYKGTIKEDSLVIGCQTIKYDNLAEIAEKVDKFMSLKFELGGMFKDIGTQTKINHSGITVIAGSESKTIPFADFLALYKQTKGD